MARAEPPMRGPVPARPLAGCRVAVTRAAHQSAELLGLLRELGAEAGAYPVIATSPAEDAAPLDAALAAVERFDWLAFTSANAARAVASRATVVRGSPAGGAAGFPRVAAVGEATARALRGAGVTPHLVAAESTGAGLAAALGDVRGLRILLPRGDLAMPDLPAALRAGGAEVTEVIAYRTVPGMGVEPLLECVERSGLDAVTVASPSAVRFVVETARATGRLPLLTSESAPAIICVGPTTAEAVREAGVRVAAVAERQDDRGLADAVVRWRRHTDAGAGGNA